MKTYSFSHLQKALLAAGSFSCLGLSLSPVWVHAANENEISQLEKLTVIAQMTYDQPEVNLYGFSQQNLAEIPEIGRAHV